MKVKDWLGENATEFQVDVVEKKYLQGDSLEEFFDRVSLGDPDIRRLIVEKKFLFGGRILANVGKDNGAGLNNCYSLGYIDDSYDDILEANKQLGLTLKAQGGQGLSLTKLRPKGTGIQGGQFQSDGIIPFMKIFHQTTESTSQAGARRGALLMSCDAWHGDIVDFINCKSEQGQFTSANLSVEIDDKFMYLAKKGTTKTMKHNYSGNEKEWKINAKEVLRLIAEKAHENGEPGVLFVNKYRHYNLTDPLEDYEIATGNACSEAPLKKHAACLLGSINLSEFVIDPWTPSAKFDVNGFLTAVNIAVRGLDMVVDLTLPRHALPEQRQTAEEYRNIGLGFMGLADCFVKLGITYGSPESIEFVDNLGSAMFKTAVISSSLIAEEKGSFPKYESSVFDTEIIKAHFTEEERITLKQRGLRNCSLLSIAPSGSISATFGVGSGIEPFFALEYERTAEAMGDKSYVVYQKAVNEFMSAYPGENLPDCFVTAKDIPWVSRIGIQAALQKHVDMAISSTINLPNETTVEEVEEILYLAHKSGLKGVTVFREGCLREALLKAPGSTKTDTETPEEKRGDWSRKPDDTQYFLKKVYTGCGKLRLFVGWSPSQKRVVDLYVKRSARGGCESSIETTVIAMSGMLRLGGDLQNIVKAFEGLRTCPSFTQKKRTGERLSEGVNCGSAILNAVLEVEAEQGATVKEEVVVEQIAEYKGDYDTMTCPQCGKELMPQGGCFNCVCGYSKCED